MKLLFDQNLSHRLPRRLSELFPGSEHVRTAGLDRSTDDAIWEHAKAGGFCIVTQDADFAERSRVRGAPPKVVWLRCGNTTPREVERILRQSAAVISQLISDPALHSVELFP